MEKVSGGHNWAMSFRRAAMKEKGCATSIWEILSGAFEAGRVTLKDGHAASKLISPWWAWGRAAARIQTGGRPAGPCARSGAFIVNSYLQTSAPDIYCRRRHCALARPAIGGTSIRVEALGLWPRGQGADSRA